MNQSGMKRPDQPSPSDLSDSKRVTKVQKKDCKQVRFAADLEAVYHIPYEDDPLNHDTEAEANNESSSRSSKATEEFTILSSAHGRARRELRSITKFDLQSAVKHGVKTRGFRCPKTKLPRWKYVYGNVVYITDWTSTKEVTSYQQEVKIQPAMITPEMYEKHAQDVQALKDDPQLCATHSIIIIDQSGSMRTSDVNGFRNRSQAAYGVLALMYISEQLHQRSNEDGGILDAISIVEMSDTAKLVFDRQPLDWILFNEIINRQKASKPGSHGNYNQALSLASNLVNSELEGAQNSALEDLPSLVLVFLSDCKPSDKTPLDSWARKELLLHLCNKLKSNLSFYAIGLGASGADFTELENMVSLVKSSGAEATFSFSKLSCADLGNAFSSVSESVTATRTGMFQFQEKSERIKKNVELRKKNVPARERKYHRYLEGVSRWEYDHEKYIHNVYPWTQVKFNNRGACGFDMESSPFGKGAERLAYMFYEINKDRRRVGKAMVAKESININTEERKVEFHEDFCRVQRKASELATNFNRTIKKVQCLLPVDKSMKTPDISFLKCFVYEYYASDGEMCGLLVENYLKGKFTKYNSNQGFVHMPAQNEATISLGIGEVFLTDFVQAFSHWVYFSTNQSLLLCDLQGVLNEEGRHRKFELTDPCICSKGSKSRERYGRTDIGMKGIRSFRKKHRCNKVCEGLGLPIFGRK